MLNVLFGYFLLKELENIEDAVINMEKTIKKNNNASDGNVTNNYQFNQQNNVIISKEEYLRLKGLE